MDQQLHEVMAPAAAPDMNNLGVDWLRCGDATKSFHFFHNTIQRFKAGRVSILPSSSQSVGTSLPDVNSSRGMSSDEQMNRNQTPRSRFEGIYANNVLFQEQVYSSPFKIAYTCDSTSFFFSPDPTKDYIICSMIAVFNMALSVQAMDNTAATRNCIHDRHLKTKALYEHCLQLLSLIYQPSVSTGCEDIPSSGSHSKAYAEDDCQVSDTNTGASLIRDADDTTMATTSMTHVALATCDLITMACLNNLILMSLEYHLHDFFKNKTHLETLLRVVATIRPERYNNDREITNAMGRLADMFLVTIFFIIKFPPTNTAAAA